MMPTKSRPMARMAAKTPPAKRATEMMPMRKTAPMAAPAKRAPEMMRKAPGYSHGGSVKGKSK